VILKSYFDGANQGDSRIYDVLSLAAISGTKDEWIPFEKAWEKVTTKHKVLYLHTTDAVARKGIYKGWSESERDAFLRDCVRVACKHCARVDLPDNPGKFGLFCYVVSIVLKDFVARAKSHPGAPTNVNESCLREALGETLLWSQNQARCEHRHFFFDRGEPFHGHLDQILQSKKALKDAFLLQKISHTTESDMKRFPGLQLADLYAWCASHRNHEWNPTWKRKLLSSHYRWNWIDKTNIHDVNHAHQRNFLSWKLPSRSATK
jgi:hypothetical protein